MTRKAGEQRPFKCLDGKGGPDPQRNRAGSVPNNAHLIDGRYPSPSNRDSANDGGDTLSPRKGDDSSRDGDDEDHFAVEMAPPAKCGRVNDGGRVPCKGHKVIVESDDEDDAEVDDTFLVGIDELLKGDDIGPLAFD